MNEKEELLSLYEELKRHNQAYYDDDEPTITDFQYDKLKLRAQEIENKYPQWIDPDSPTQKVGGTPSKGFLKHISHEEKLLSVKDVYSKEDIILWWKSQGSPICCAEEKIDGVSLALTYIDGKLVLGATRGDGEIGEDVSLGCFALSGIPQVFPEKYALSKSKLIVRTEIIQYASDFIAVNSTVEKQGKKLFRNPRNCAASSLRTNDPNIISAHFLQAKAFDIMLSEGFESLPCDIKPGVNQIQDLSFLSLLGFSTAKSQKVSSEEEILYAVSELEKNQASLPYWTDGAVIKVFDIPLRKKLGSVKRHPNWSVAYKYPVEEAETIISHIDIKEFASGRLVPIAHFTPVTLSGNKVSFAYLSGPEALTAMGEIAECDHVIVSQASEINPKIISILTEKRNPNAEIFKIEKCPFCSGEVIIKEHGNLFCENPKCIGKKTEI